MTVGPLTCVSLLVILIFKALKIDATIFCTKKDKILNRQAELKIRYMKRRIFENKGKLAIGAKLLTDKERY